MFWGVGGLQIRNDLLRNLGSKDSHDKLGDFLGLCGFLKRKNAGKYEYIGMCMRENGTICVFGVFFPNFIVFFASELDIILLKRSVSGV